MIAPQMAQGRKVYSNIWLRGAEKISTEAIPYIVKANTAQFKDTIFFVDEIHTIVDARRSSANVDFTGFITQLGKLNCDLYYTAQIVDSQIDRRLRELGDLFLFCTRYLYIKGNWVNGALYPRKVSYPVCIQYRAFLKQEGGLSWRQWSNAYIPTKQDYSIYDTTELVVVKNRYSNTYNQNL